MKLNNLKAFWSKQLEKLNSFIETQKIPEEAGFLGGYVGRKQVLDLLSLECFLYPRAGVRRLVRYVGLEFSRLSNM